MKDSYFFSYASHSSLWVISLISCSTIHLDAADYKQIPGLIHKKDFDFRANFGQPPGYTSVDGISSDSEIDREVLLRLEWLHPIGDTWHYSFGTGIDINTLGIRVPLVIEDINGNPLSTSEGLIESDTIAASFHGGLAWRIMPSWQLFGRAAFNIGFHETMLSVASAGFEENLERDDMTAIRLETGLLFTRLDSGWQVGLQIGYYQNSTDVVITPNYDPGNPIGPLPITLESNGLNWSISIGKRY